MTSTPKPATAELQRWIGAARTTCTRDGAGALAQALQDIRRVARLHRIGPALIVLHALDGALARGEAGPLVEGWLALLHDAVGCASPQRRDEDLFAAACSVRLAG